MAEKDYTPIILGTGAVVAVGLGVYLWARTPGTKPGTEMIATFKYKHIGAAGDFYLQVMLGHIRAVIFFDEVEGLKWRTQESAEAHFEWTEITHKVGFQLPDVIDAGKYDAEASIRTLDDKIIIRHLQKSAVLVPEL